MIDETRKESLARVVSMAAADFSTIITILRLADSTAESVVTAAGERGVAMRRDLMNAMRVAQRGIAELYKTGLTTIDR